MIDILKGSDLEHFVMQEGVAIAKFKPPHWDTSSIAELLLEASLGFPSSRKFRDAGKLALAAHHHMRAPSKRFPKGLQNNLYEISLDALYPDSIPRLLQKRLRILDSEVSIASSLNFGDLRESLKFYSKYIVFSVIRTWANGWVTSHQMPETVRCDCLLGCNGEPDDLHHYLRCERLWRALKTVLKASSTVPPLMTNASILEKLAITGTSDRLVLNICLVSHAYHTIKANYRDHFVQASTNDIAKIAILILQAADIRFKAMLAEPRHAFGCRDEVQPRIDPQVCPSSALIRGSAGTGFVGHCDSASRLPQQHHGSPQELFPIEPAVSPRDEVGREFCEPECNDLPVGLHHACCSQALLLAELSGRAEHHDEDMSGYI